MNIHSKLYFLAMLLLAASINVFAQQVGSVVGKLDHLKIQKHSTDPGFDLNFHVRDGEYNQVVIKPLFSVSHLFIKDISKNNNLLWIKKANQIPSQNGFACWFIDEQSQSVVISFGGDFLGANDSLTIYLGLSATPKDAEMLTMGSIFINTVSQKKYDLEPIQINNK